MSDGCVTWSEQSPTNGGWTEQDVCDSGSTIVTGASEQTFYVTGTKIKMKNKSISLNNFYVNSKKVKMTAKSISYNSFYANGKKVIMKEV